MRPRADPTIILQDTRVPVAVTPDREPPWHPRVRQLYRFWESIRRPGMLPGRQHIDPGAIRELLPDIWMLDVQPEPFRLRYRLAGTGITASHRRELTGLWMDEAHPQLRNNALYFERYKRVVATAEPSWRKGPPVTDHLCWAVENLILPLARNGRDVDMLLCITQMHKLPPRDLDSDQPAVANTSR